MPDRYDAGIAGPRRGGEGSTRGKRFFGRRASDMPMIAGVDGCRGGWIVAMGRLEGRSLGRVEIRLCPTFDEILKLRPRFDIVSIDMPIGLLDKQERGGRECDRAARRLLGRPRSSSVFNPPTRRMLGAKTYEEVRHHGLSIQSFGILAKIREVDARMTPHLQKRVLECHPELAFMALGGAAAKHNKKTPEGRKERIECLRSIPRKRFPDVMHVLNEWRVKKGRSKIAGEDDLLDACALLWLAGEIALGRVARLPERPARDVRGLRMEVWGVKERVKGR